jgi:flagellar hook protein FlgE
MMSILYICASGLKTHGEGLGVIGHNIANVNTIGYKQQSMQFDDIFYATLPSGGGWETQQGAKVALSQVGMGVRPGAVRTLFAEQGPIEPGVGIFDMAILGKGFFQVTNPDTNLQYYTRAGNFHLNKDGVLCDPNEYFVTGIPIAAGASAPVQGPLTGGGPIVIDPSRTCPPKATTALSLSMNLGIADNRAQDDAHPYFSLLQSWDATSSPPLDP